MASTPWTCVCGDRNVGPSPCSRCLSPAPTDLATRPLIPQPSPPGPQAPLLRKVLGVLVGVLVLAGGLAAVRVDPAPTTVSREKSPQGPSTEGQTITVTPDSAPEGLPGVAGEIAAAMPALMQFVQRERGLPFKEPVEVTLLGDEAFRARLTAANEPDADEDEAEAAEAAEATENNRRVLVALGLLDDDVDIEEASEALLGDAVAGYYDTDDDSLVVRGEEFSPGVRVTFVHELTHALQDQHFDLDREDIDERDDESSQAFTSVIEGDASRIEDLYVDSFTGDERKAYEREQIDAGAGISDEIPPILIELIAFPYIAGPDFARAVVDEGGQSALDDAFTTPPTTSEQIIHPDLYVEDGESPRQVTSPEPPDGKEAIDQGVVGEYGLILVLQRLTDQRTAVIASNGWGGDRYVAWDEGDDTCVRTDVVMDTARDARELVVALEEAADERDGFTVTTSPELISFTSCG